MDSAKNRAFIPKNGEYSCCYKKSKKLINNLKLLLRQPLADVSRLEVRYEVLVT